LIKLACQLAGVVIVLASTAGLLLSYVTVDETLAKITLWGLGGGTVVAISPDAIARIAEKYLTKK